MSYTETQTITHAYRKAGLLGATETLSNDDLAFGQNIYRSRIASLQSRGVNLWNFASDSVPDEYLDPISDYVGLFLLAASGGGQPSDEIVLSQEMTLRQLGMAPPTYDVIESDYY